MPRHDDEDESNVARMPGATAVAGMGDSRRGGDDERVKSDEAALRRVANTGGVGAFAVAQAAPGGRRQGPRIRRTASARRRARQRAGIEPAEPEGGAEAGGGGGEREQEINPDDLIAADVEMEQMIMEEEDEGETLGFWQLDRTDKVICGGICCLVVALIVILAVAMT
mmetsp:Transcript_18252/g.31408  ORF Transcript_18252/g.31408 Transcript_18252/m.31408 type:complete len:168 (-) Transcript_18252:382-885(-)|eukprot:CAMPEP_0183730706 /NCGR_PEP_ID=MMETSP0737-20130205/33512_1 /TAXON_ID=385413 /ORGANISM="Thalassiosira miniscula, Strain CCMP1093" /LENGTH=167 /DNA_ID=CAMNT_0025963273 /DNA_START=215 /DNA_END=718 /DNA_ORIENTATION=+